MRKLFIWITGLFFFHANAQSFTTSADIYLSLRKLNVLGSVLYIAAHPDDENTRLLAYLAKDKLYRTGYLSLTRGDGGQNLIGDEQGVELGLIRTQELLSARKIDGAEQFFTRAFDFGFSKNPGETFNHWDKEKILADVVWMIRKFQPDVIITRFPVTGEGGHGHHTVSSILANEAFTAAANPARFPEQLKYVKPWQAKRILWNTFNFGSTNTTASDQFHFDVGGYNAVLGKSYGEIAAESRSQHKSQGFGVPRSRGEAMEYFRTTGGDAPVKDLMDDVPLTWSRIPGSERTAGLINKAISDFDLLHPEKSLPALVEIHRSLQALAPGYWRDQKLKEVQQLIESASGIFIEAYSNDQYISQGDSLKINISLNDRLGVGSSLKKITIEKQDAPMSVNLSPNKNLNLTQVIWVSPSKEITQPYWLKSKMEEGYFNIGDQLMIGEPDVQPAYSVTFSINIAGADFVTTRPVKYKFSDPVRGEVYEPLVVLPPVTFNAVNPFFLKGMKNNGSVDVDLTASRNVQYPQGSEQKISDTSLLTLGPVTLRKKQVYSRTLPLKDLAPQTYWFNVSNGEKSPGTVLRSINYNHIPAINYFKPAQTTIREIDLKTYNKHIGYIAGAGDKVPDALEQMGYEVTMLGEKDVARMNLQQFDAIITGVRAFNTNEWLNKYHEKLMKYVEEGGNYIVQYSQANNIRAKMGPYNFSLSGKRITDEKAPVTFLLPGHPVLNFPNKINQDDFRGWIQERSIYHATDIDPHYQTIFRMNDPQEQPDDGSLIIAPYGKGFFSYTGLVFFRELPAGVPGAFRLMANLIALNRKKEF